MDAVTSLAPQFSAILEKSINRHTGIQANEQPESKQDNGKSLHDMLEEAKESSVDYMILRELLEIEGSKSSESVERASFNTDKLKESIKTTQIQSQHIRTDQVEIRSSGSAEQRISVSTEASRERIRFNGVTYERVSLSIDVQIEEEVEQGDPLALDLNGDGLKTTGVANGVNFDLDGDGEQEKMSFVTGGDAFLALDKNKDGVINSGKELFGDFDGDRNGFDALAKYDDNKDNQIDKKDNIFDSLRLLSINNASQQTMQSLTSAGIKSISLGYRNSNQALNSYDYIAQTSSFERENGKTGLAGDLMLGYK